MWGWPLIAAALGLTTVTDKAGALKNIVQYMHRYEITLTEIENSRETFESEQTTQGTRNKGDIAKTLFTYLGAIFIFSGVGTYIGMFWDSMGSTMRVFVTLGVGYILLIVQISALQEKKFPKLILPLSIASMLVMTGGWFVLIDEVFPHGDNWRVATLSVFGVMALQQSILFQKYKQTFLVFSSLLYIYGFMQVGLDLLNVPMAYIAIVLGASLFVVGTALEKTVHRVIAEFTLFIGSMWLNGGLFDRIMMFTSANWASLIIGVSLMFTAYGFQKTKYYARLSSLGYLLGSIMIYSGLFDLVENSMFELLYLAVTASILYACVVLQSRSLLLTTVISMLSFIGYYSSKHFANSLGWPVTLVLMGITFLGVGTLALKVKQRIKS